MLSPAPVLRPEEKRMAAETLVQSGIDHSDARGAVGYRNPAAMRIAVCPPGPWGIPAWRSSSCVRTIPCGSYRVHYEDVTDM